ncbi:MAG: DNA/RNA non-specific endonuclease [Phycisphaerales bacterium]|nr:DNA/RNA non-specific endonuclease [Phycisphaerales bacterium]
MASRHHGKWPIILILVVIAVGVEWYVQNRREQPAKPPTATTSPATTTAARPDSVHLLLGNPSDATADPTHRDNYLMIKPYYALSYNNSKGTANWVSWRVVAADLGDAPRQPSFDPDTQLPYGFVRIVHRDYSGSGFDRGHLCPHADRDATAAMSASTFVMTNIIPQAPNVNEKAWARLESYSRRQVRRHHRLYIVSGPIGVGGRGLDGIRQTIAGGKVTVPSACWKIITIVPEAGGDDDLAKITADTRVIAIIMPNDNDQVGDQWSGYRTSVAEIERQTGYRFFDRLPADVAAALKQKVDKVRIASEQPFPRPTYDESGDRAAALESADVR